MTRCTATVTLAVTEPCDAPAGAGASRGCSHTLPDGTGYVPMPDGTVLHVELVTLECDNEQHPRDAESDHRHGVGTSRYAAWSDTTPGATPHREPLVTDEDVIEVTKEFWRWYDPGDDEPDRTNFAMRNALAAYAERLTARLEQ